MTLKDIVQGKNYQVKAIDTPLPGLVSKILALGIVPGETIELMHTAPLGDPMQIKAGSTYISIRRQDGAFIQVELLADK